ncbi:hypothetical protein [Aquimarina sp. RZ0]|uniref:hypothetical protein n=1 Tax=Aquimarina sp. RZ0 TaxID=2607730 RepID=UPI0011F32574|nr:hypothetical protein [Aquimarina sp. RZ0]KAA1242808.1 hypothetical protein F0000_23865 [Aquimarina sp. RZ0]
MKTINFFAKSILPVAVLLSIYSCEKDETTIVTEEKILAEDSIEQVGIPEEEWITDIHKNDTKNLISTVSGRDYKHFYIDYNGDRTRDLVAVRTKNTGTRSTEIHILDGKSGYSRFLLQTGTAMPELHSHFEIHIGKSRKEGLLLYVILRKNTGTHSTEFHVISEKNGFHKFYSQNGSPIPESPNYRFKLLNRTYRDHLHYIEVFKNGYSYRTLDAKYTYKRFLDY